MSLTPRAAGCLRAGEAKLSRRRPVTEAVVAARQKVDGHHGVQDGNLRPLKDVKLLNAVSQGREMEHLPWLHDSRLLTCADCREAHAFGGPASKRRERQRLPGSVAGI